MRLDREATATAKMAATARSPLACDRRLPTAPLIHSDKMFWSARPRARCFRCDEAKILCAAKTALVHPAFESRASIFVVVDQRFFFNHSMALYRHEEIYTRRVEMWRSMRRCTRRRTVPLAASRRRRALTSSRRRTTYRRRIVERREITYFGRVTPDVEEERAPSRACEAPTIRRRRHDSYRVAVSNAEHRGQQQTAAMPPLRAESPESNRRVASSPTLCDDLPPPHVLPIADTPAEVSINRDMPAIAATRQSAPPQSTPTRR